MVLLIPVCAQVRQGERKGGVSGRGPAQVVGTVGSFFFNDTATTEIYTLSLHDALPIYKQTGVRTDQVKCHPPPDTLGLSNRSEEHTSELQSLRHLVCRLLLEKKKK